mmetsp:Transcript_16410/g.34813  ORF Transcript_16410/g.34813 Transcript_16410/m.34813 type:complete len:403 (+) Transcript_16410:1366-2574(+)
MLLERHLEGRPPLLARWWPDRLDARQARADGLGLRSLLSSRLGEVHGLDGLVLLLRHDQLLGLLVVLSLDVEAQPLNARRLLRLGARQVAPSGALQLGRGLEQVLLGVGHLLVKFDLRLLVWRHRHLHCLCKVAGLEVEIVPLQTRRLLHLLARLAAADDALHLGRGEILRLGRRHRLLDLCKVLGRDGQLLGLLEVANREVVLEPFDPVLLLALRPGILSADDALQLRRGEVLLALLLVREALGEAVARGLGPWSDLLRLGQHVRLPRGLDGALLLLGHAERERAVELGHVRLLVVGEPLEAALLVHLVAHFVAADRALHAHGRHVLVEQRCVLRRRRRSGSLLWRSWRCVSGRLRLWRDRELKLIAWDGTVGHSDEELSTAGRRDTQHVARLHVVGHSDD